jgi:hypothetical protein
MRRIYMFFWWLWNYPEIMWIKIKQRDINREMIRGL